MSETATKADIHTTEDRADSVAELLSLTNDCVLCGMCSISCPTYAVNRVESETPRGRISLVRAYLSGELQNTAEVTTHIDSCLLCRTCEAMCPAKVKMGRIIDGARAVFSEDGLVSARNSGLSGKVSSMIRSRGRRRGLSRALAVYQKSGVQWLLRRTGFMGLSSMRKLDERLPAFSFRAAFKPFYPATNRLQGAVALFVGCVAEQGDRDTLESAISLLNKFGFNVMVPPGQGCCGANDLHQGNTQVLPGLIGNNLSAFGKKDIDAVVTVASGCGSVLKEYDLHAAHAGLDKAAAATVTAKISDISEFLLACDWPDNIDIREYDGMPWLHKPCSQKFSAADTSASEKLLDKAGVKTVDAKSDSSCCGASGVQLIGNIASAVEIGEPLAAFIESLEVSEVLTTNFTCGLHIKSMLEMRGAGKVRMRHPVTLLDEIISVN